MPRQAAVTGVKPAGACRGATRRGDLTISMEDSSMAQEREERPGAAIKKTSEAGDDSTRRTAGTQSRSAPRELEAAHWTHRPPAAGVNVT